MSSWELYLMLILGLVSSLHCVSMCGPLVISYSLPLASLSHSKQIVAHLAYNGGRILTYSLLGAAAGLLGGAVGFVGNLAGIENGAAIIAGILMVGAGIVMLDLLPIDGMQKLNPLRYTSRILKPLGNRISSSSVGSKFSLGLLLGFMPCGLIYAALLKAIATGSVLAGSLTMMAFGLGTIASLLGIGILSFVFSMRLNRWGNRMAAISVILLGFFLIARGAMPMMAASHEKEEVPACHQSVNSDS